MIVKLLIVPFMFVMFGSFFFVQPAHAQFNPTDGVCAELNETERKESELCNEGKTTDNPVTGTEGVLLKTTNILAIAAAVIAIIIIIVAGIQMTLSTGDSQKVSNSRNAIIYAAVGIIVIVLSRSVVIFIINRIG